VGRRRQYSLHTERAYARWIKRFVPFHDTPFPRNLGATDVRAFLNHLAVERNVAAFTQNRVLNAVVFLYDFDYERICVRDGKGGKDQTAVFPDRLREPLQPPVA
jgi:site-specific recombinase XerD